MVDGLETGGWIFDARSVLSGKISGESDDPGLVMSHPDLDAVAQAFTHQARVFGESESSIPVRPATLVLEGLGEVIMEQADRVRSAWRAVHPPGGRRNPNQPGWPRRCRKVGYGSRPRRNGTPSGRVRPSD